MPRTIRDSMNSLFARTTTVEAQDVNEGDRLVVGQDQLDVATVHDVAYDSTHSQVVITLSDLLPRIDEGQLGPLGAPLVTFRLKFMQMVRIVDEEWD